MKFFLLMIPVFLVGDRVGAALLGRFLAQSQDRYVTMYVGRAQADVLVLGNSRADNHFPPSLMRKKLGHSAVNLGLGGISMVLAEALLRDYVEHNGKPKLLIVEPTSLTVDPTVIGDMRLFAIYSERMSSLVRGYMPKFYYAASAFNLFHFNNEMFFRASYNVVKPPEDRLHQGTIRPELMEVLRTRGAYALENQADNEAAFVRLMSYAHAQGIETVIVSTPYLPMQHAKIKNYADWWKRTQELAGANVRTFDYGKRFDDTDLFMDSVHMNARGSERLLEVMIEDGVFGTPALGQPPGLLESAGAGTLERKQPLGQMRPN